jgi:hypothetical protein
MAQAGPRTFLDSPFFGVDDDDDDQVCLRCASADRTSASGLWSPRTRLPNKWTEIRGAGAAQSANMLARDFRSSGTTILVFLVPTKPKS